MNTASKPTIGKQDALMLFIAFDTLSNNKNIPPEILTGVAQAYQNFKNYLISENLIKSEQEAENNTESIITS